MKEFIPLGFDHLEDGLTTGYLNRGSGLIALGWDADVVRNVNTARGMGIWSVGSDLIYGLNVANTGGSVTGMVQIILGSIFGMRTDFETMTFGFKFTPITTPATANSPVIGLKQTRVTSFTGIGPEVTLLAYSGTELAAGYYEFEMIVGRSGVGGSIKVYRDGVLINTVAAMTTNQWWNETIKDRCLTIGTALGVQIPASSPVGTPMFALSNFYVSWSNVRGESLLKGPITVKQLPVKSLSTPNWLSSDSGKTPLEVLNMTNHHGTVLTPVITSDDAMTPLRVKFDTSSIPDGLKIHGVRGATSARRVAGTSAQLSTKWSQPGGDSEAVTYNPTFGDWTTQLDVPLPAVIETPAGTPLTKATLDQLEMVLTPSG